MSGCRYFARYWAICVLSLLVNQAVTSSFLEGESPTLIRSIKVKLQVLQGTCVRLKNG